MADEGDKQHKKEWMAYKGFCLDKLIETGEQFWQRRADSCENLLSHLPKDT